MKGLLNYLKGLAIGVCSLVPGVSGGTMALILGIYERLISAIGSFSFTKLFTSFKFRKTPAEKRRVKSFFKRLDFPFLLTIIAGVVTMLFLGATGILQLLETHYAYTISFFIGLIIASAFFIFKQIENHKLSTIIIFLSLGLLLGFLFLFIVPTNLVNPPFWYLIISGFFGIVALFLPGISGSLILLLLGTYEFMLNMLTDPLSNLVSIGSFAIGMILGAILISKLIAKLLKTNKSAVFYFLLGLIFGSLSIPLRDIFAAGIPSYLFSGLFFIAGFVIVLLLEKR